MKWTQRYPILVLLSLSKLFNSEKRQVQPRVFHQENSFIEIPHIRDLLSETHANLEQNRTEHVRLHVRFEDRYFQKTPFKNVRYSNPFMPFFALSRLWIVKHVFFGVVSSSPNNVKCAAK